MDTRGMMALQMVATNDPNGNPRRCLLIVSTDPDGYARKVAAVDEGYLGEGGSLREAGFGDVPILYHRFVVPVRQYRAALRDLPNTREEAEQD